MGGSEVEDRFLARLSGLGEVSSCPRFGGDGIDLRGVSSASRIEGGSIKADDQSRPAFEARGMGPFCPNERQTLKSYYEVPPDVLDDPEALLSKAGEAIWAGMAS